MDLPVAFDATIESVKFLARAKQRAAKSFSFTKSSALQYAADLAFWLYLFGREDEALEVCEFLGDPERRHFLASQLQARAVENYGLSAMADATEAVYRKVCPLVVDARM